VLGSAVFSALTVVLLMVVVLPLSMRGPTEPVARLVFRFANISLYRCVDLSTSTPSDSLLIQCLLSSRHLGVLARSSPNLRPDPWGGIGHPTGNPVREDGSIAGRVGRITVRNAGTARPG
jgi:hypothetical protein